MIRAIFNFLRPSAPGGLRAGHYVAGLLASALLNVGLIAPHSVGSIGPKNYVAWCNPGVAASLRLYCPPNVPVRTNFATPLGTTPQVVGLRTNDTGVDISNAINAAARVGGFSGPGYAALIGVESGVHQYAPHYPINGAGYCDYSGGLTQITVCTAAGLGIGDGSMSTANINYVFWYEQGDANRDVAFSGRLVSQFKAEVCFDFWPLYAAWNEGPGYGCGSSAYTNPSNAITQQALRIYMGWYDWVYTYHVRYTAPVPPKPKPVWHFPTKRWCRYDRAHHLKCPSAYWKRDQLGKVPFTWAHWRHAFHGKKTVDHVCGGVVRAERWNSELRMEKQRFSHCIAYSWPRYRNDPVKWVRLHRPKAPAPAPTPGQPAPSPTARPIAPAPTPTQAPQSPESYLLGLINAERQSHGYVPLTLDAKQSAKAQLHSFDMASTGSIWHVNSNFPFESWPAEIVVPYHAAGENVGEAGGPEKSAILYDFTQMLTGPGETWTPGCVGSHHCSIDYPAFSSVGIGLAQAGGLTYVTEDFIG